MGKVLARDPKDAARKKRRRSKMIQEVGRLVVSICLLVLVAFLYGHGFSSPDVAEKLGCTNLASVTVGAITTYWLKPAPPPRVK